jgi:DNA repair exonuclease SbcCD ATPase subunit
MRQERAAFETLVARGGESTEHIARLTQSIADAQQSLVELQTRAEALHTRMEAVQRLAPMSVKLDEQAQEFANTQRRIDAQATHTADDVKRLRSEVEELRHTLELAATLKNDLAGLLQLGGGFKALRIDADNLTAQLGEFAQGVDKVRERQEKIGSAGDAAVARLDAVAERHQQTHATVATTENRVAEIERKLESLSEAAAQVVETKRQLATAKALGDYVTQKLVALERQREGVDRALGQAEQLNIHMQEINLKVQQQSERAKDVAELEATIKDLQALHSNALERSIQVTARQEEIERADEDMRGRLAAVRDEVQRNVEWFEGENQVLEASGQRIVDLRGELTDLEGRFQALDGSRRVIEDVRTRTDGVASQLGAIADDVAQLQTQAERVRALQQSADRVADTVEGVTNRVARLETTQPTIEAVLNDFASLKGTHEGLREATEQMRLAADEVARVRQDQAENRVWLTGVVESVDAVRGKMAELDALKPTVEVVRAAAERVAQAAEQIESRGQLVEEVHARLAEVASLGSRLDERSQGLLARMDAAEDRFKALALHAEETERIEKLMPTVAGAVERAERRIGELDTTVRSLESRRVDLEALSERTTKLGQELELRQTALDRASEHLQRASKLREEAATAAQALDERTRQLSGGLGTATDRLGDLTERLEEIETRAQSVRFMQKRMAQFEERLAKWETVELELSRSLEQVTRRQASMDTLQAGIQRVFETVDRTVDEVRSIAAAQQEVAETRTLLENVLGLVEHAHDVANGLEHR